MTGTVRDDRLALKGYVPINKCLNCPYLPFIDIENSKPDTATWSEYSLWYSFRYAANGGFRCVAP